MNAPLDYYRLIKDMDCMSCGTYGTHENPIEAAHIVSVLSNKTGDLWPRSHKGAASWGAIPLCKNCHALLHFEGNERVWLTENVGQYKAQGRIIRTLIDIIEKLTEETDA